MSSEILSLLDVARKNIFHSQAIAEKLEKENKMLRECVKFTIENSGTSSNYNLKCRETLKQLKESK